MDSPKLEAALSKQLSDEFGVHGKRAVASLETAQRLLELEADLLPRHGETVAFCLRVALDEIPRASGVSDPRHLRSPSEAVVDAADQYETSLESSGDEIQIARQALFSRIKDLQEFLEGQEGGHQERLKELIRQRTGTEPLSSGTAPLREYQRLLNQCNHAAHNDCALDEARRLWSECLELLQRFFLAHDRDPEPLSRLARIDSPSDADLADLLRQLTTPVELQSFLRRVEKPGWLWQLGRSDALGMPGSVLWWAACTAAIRLSDIDRNEVVQWLDEMHSQHPARADHAQCFAYAARRIAGTALDLLFRIVRKHPTDERIALEGLNAARNLDAAHPMVIEFADALLNATSWDLLHSADKLVNHVASGINAGNSLDRITRMSLKLRQVQDDLAISALRLFPSGTMDDAHKVFPHDRASVLLGCVTRMLRTAWDWHPASVLLECIDEVPDTVRDRLRTWILGNAADVDPDALVAEVSATITTRDATGDDVALIERAMDLGDSVALRASWLNALGDVPDVDRVQRAVDGEESLPENLWRAKSWIPILPESVTETWAAPCRVLTDATGEVSREQLLTRTLPQGREIGSPMDAQHFAGMSPMDAAETIALWRPDAAEFYVSASGLGSVLQELVAEDPAGWLFEPVGIVKTLHHPTYISAYLRATEKLTDHPATEVSRLLDAAKLVVTEPWQVVPLDRSRHRYEPDWREGRRAAVELIGTITASGAQFDDRADEVWELIETAARHQTPSEAQANDDDQTVRADVHASMRALDLAVLFVEAELQASKPLRPEFEQLLDYSLRLSGDLGLEHRKVIASNLRWLRHRLPEWTASAMGLIIGSEAPDGLGETTFEWVLRRNPPIQWLCEGYPEMLHEAARRQQEPALGHVLVAMLWGWKGHSAKSVAGLLERHTELIYEAAERVSKLLRDDEVDEGHLAAAVELWEVLLQSAAASSVAGFGWMSIVTALADGRWSELTRKTIDATRGQFGWDEEVAKRSMTEPLTVDKLAILDLLVRHTPSDWVRRCIADNADMLLGVGPDLAATPEYLRLRTALIGHGLVATG